MVRLFIILGSSIKKIPRNTIEDVFYRVYSGDLDYGVIPVENSSEGVVNTSLNCLADFKRTINLW